MKDLTKEFLELIRLAATNLPPDVEKAIVEARENEDESEERRTSGRQ